MLENKSYIKLNASIQKLDAMLKDDTELKAIQEATKVAIRANVIGAIIASVSILLFTLFI